MTDIAARLEGYTVNKLHLRIPGCGPWYFDARIDGAPSPQLSGTVTLTMGGVSFTGTVDPSASGTYLIAGAIRVVAGANGWSKVLKSRSYHNDGGVRGKLVATDAAAECGESLVEYSGRDVIGNDFAREGGEASRAIEYAAGGVPWWVDLDGNTHVAPRPSSTVNAPMIDWDVRSRMASFAVFDPAEIAVGGLLKDSRLTESQTIRELELIIDGGKMQVFGWCGGVSSSPSRLARAFRSAVRRVLPQQLLGAYQYRVVSRRVDGRLDLQKVKGGADLGDLSAVKVCPGVAGVDIDPMPGSKVIVVFLDGVPTEPRVTSFADLSDGAFVPRSISFLRGTRPIARVGDQVTVFASPGIPIPITGTVAGAPLAGVITIATPIYGVIATGEPRLRG